MHVDADHAFYQVTRKSVTGILLFVNSMSVKWYSKRQNTMETSTYGAELVALRIAEETMMEFSYKLRMMGVPIQGPSQVLCDNKSVVLNTSPPLSMLKNKHNTIASHRVWEAVAAQIVKVRHTDGKENIGEILTKAADHPTFRKHLKAGLVSL